MRKKWTSVKNLRQCLASTICCLSLSYYLRNINVRSSHRMKRSRHCRLRTAVILRSLPSLLSAVPASSHLLATTRPHIGLSISVHMRKWRLRQVKRCVWWYPAGKQFDPRHRASFTAWALHSSVLCCCHPEILNNFRTRCPRFHLANYRASPAQIWPTPELALLTPTTHLSYSWPRVVFQFIGTVFSVGLKSWG